MKENNITDENNISPKRKRKRKITPAFVTVIFFAIIACVMLGAYLVYKYLPNFEVISPKDYYDFSSLPLLVLEDNNTFYDTPVIIRDGTVFLPSDFVAGNIDPYFFWEEDASRLTITTETEVIKIAPDVNTYTINGVETSLSTAFFTHNGFIYAPQDFLRDRYLVSVGYNEAESIVLIDYLSNKYKTAVMEKKADVRYKPGIKANISCKLQKGDAVTVYEYSEDGKYARIRTLGGIVGYVYTKTIGGIAETEALEIKKTEPYPIKDPIEGKVVLVWDQMENSDANKNESKYVKHNGVNVLSPTWFSFDTEGDQMEIISLADKEYVNFARSNGCRVWALVTDNFNTQISHAVLSDANARDYTINTLLDYVIEYDLDGINIDFEQVIKEDGKYYIQFLRELSVPLHRMGKVLSVDMYVPSAWSMYYNRTEVGKTADYVCVMTYDEYYSTSKTSGPVASIGFVENGIRDTLDEVPKEKVLMGVPFYVRVWREENVSGEIQLSSVAYGMQRALNFFTDAGCTPIWSLESGLYYAEFTTEENGNSVTYKAWIEDEMSISEKLKVATKYDVSGVACWKRGLEKEGIWDIIASY